MRREVTGRLRTPVELDREQLGAEPESQLREVGFGRSAGSRGPGGATLRFPDPFVTRKNAKLLHALARRKSPTAHAWGKC